MKLISKEDNSTLIRDALALVLKLETDNQQALATIAGSDPEDWAFDVYVERAEPWALFAEDVWPIVDVTLESVAYEGGAGNANVHQMAEGVYSIKVHAACKAEETMEGHNPADYQSAIKCQRVIMLVRNILMNWENDYLKMDPKVIGKKQISSIEYFTGKEISGLHVAAAQVTMSMRFTESTEMPTPSVLEGTDITIESDGRLVNNIKVEL